MSGHEVTIHGDPFSELQVICSCNEILLHGKPAFSLQEINEKYLNHLPYISGENLEKFASAIHGCDKPGCGWCNPPRKEMSLHEIIKAAGLPDPYPERRRPEYCWRSWPPRHTDTCGCEVRE